MVATMTTTRRQISLLLAGIAATSVPAETKSSTAIHQEVEFQAPLARLYEILVDARRFAAFTGQAAEIQPQAGAPFKLFGARIEGRNVELVPNQRIVQAWRPASWAPGVYSIVKFEFAARGTGTLVVMDHTGFAEDKWEHLNAGWPENYWQPLRKYLGA
jgi:activator of HSP90 ATPase